MFRRITGPIEVMVLFYFITYVPYILLTRRAAQRVPFAGTQV